MFEDNIDSDTVKYTEEKIIEDSEVYWNNLSKEDKLKAFGAISRRIYEAEVVGRMSLRETLHSVFNFTTESYVHARLSNYDKIHDAIFAPRPPSYERDLIKRFCSETNVEDYDSKIKDFFKGAF